MDVALERDELRVAVEISITTPTAHEIQNLASVSQSASTWLYPLVRMRRGASGCRLR